MCVLSSAGWRTGIAYSASRALGPRAADDLVVDAVVQPRDGDKDRRPQGLQVVEDLEGVSLVEADGGA